MKTLKEFNLNFQEDTPAKKKTSFKSHSYVTTAASPYRLDVSGQSPQPITKTSCVVRVPSSNSKKPKAV